MSFPFDVQIVVALHNIVVANNMLSLIAVFCAHYLPFFVAFSSFLFILSQKSRVMSFMIIYGGVAVALAVLFAIQILVARERPFEVIASIKSLIGRPLNSSFPSGHAVFFSALASGIYLSNKELGLIFALCAILIGVSRIVVGVHWPSDILVGLVLGWLVAVVTHGSLFSKI